MFRNLFLGAAAASLLLAATASASPVDVCAMTARHHCVTAPSVDVCALRTTHRCVKVS